MIPYQCQIVHKPQFGFYGDCLRACVASLLEMSPDLVPHFYQDGCDGIEGDKRLSEFLRGLGLGRFSAYFPGDVPLQELLDHIAQGTSPGVVLVLFCSVDGGNHAVLISGGKVVHDPALYVVRRYEPTTAGHWEVMGIVKL